MGVGVPAKDESPVASPLPSAPRAYPGATEADT